MVDERNGQYDGYQSQYVAFARYAYLGAVVRAYAAHFGRLFAEVVAVGEIVYEDQQASREEPLRGEVHEPEEVGPAQIEQEERGIAQRREDTAAVGHQCYEEQYGVGFVFALAVDLYEAAYEQHCGAGCPHERGEDKAAAQY